MRSAARWQTDDRSSRHVRRARLCAAPDTPPRRLAARLEEALRLASLPGENEGRAYFFQHLRVSGLPADGDRRAWLSQFQGALEEEAAAAVHGADSRASSAPAIYFRSREEGLEILLRRLVERGPVREWFWPMLVRGEASTSASPGAPTSPLGPHSVPVILEALRSAPSEWVAVAAALFAPPRIDPLRLLETIPEAVAQEWMREMDGGRRARTQTMPSVSIREQRVLSVVLHGFGLESPRALWFAAMTVLHESPSEMAAGTLLERASAALRVLLPTAPVARADREKEGKPIVEKVPAPEEAGLKPATRDASAEADTCDAVASIAPAQPGVASPDDGIPETCEPVVATQSNPPARHVWLVDGAPTRSAGLFFLLNVLARIGMPEAIASGLAAASPDLLPRLLLRLARHSKIAADDPVTQWLASQLNGDDADAAAVQREVRKWAVAVRRWCWRTGKITAREIVARHGRFVVNRADIDISLPLDEADIRIRRIGLDLDPGWLPWFGRVVRFHYSYQRRFDV
jgi:hypothetical protein